MWNQIVKKNTRCDTCVYAWTNGHWIGIEYLFIEYICMYPISSLSVSVVVRQHCHMERSMGCWCTMACQFKWYDAFILCDMQTYSHRCYDPFNWLNLWQQFKQPIVERAKQPKKILEMNRIQRTKQMLFILWKEN